MLNYAVVGSAKVYGALGLSSGREKQHRQLVVPSCSLAKMDRKLDDLHIFPDRIVSYAASTSSTGWYLVLFFSLVSTEVSRVMFHVSPFYFAQPSSLDSNGFFSSFLFFTIGNFVAFTGQPNLTGFYWLT